jgi:hypothetical protein
MHKQTKGKTFEGLEGEDQAFLTAGRTSLKNLYIRVLITLVHYPACEQYWIYIYIVLREIDLIQLM